METTDRLREIIARNEYNSADKAFILEQADALGVERPRKGKCRNCWTDCAVFCWKRLQTEQQGEGRFVLKAGVDILFNGERVNAATLTDARAERWLAAGLSKKYFVWS